MRAEGMTNLRAVCNVEYAHPAEDTPEATHAAAVHDARYNRFFLSGHFHGRYPDLVMEGLARHDDEGRIAYIDAHLAECLRALADGVPLKGYFTSSLLDNYEWSLGYDKRFGLVHVDFESLKRTPKASYHALSAALAPV